jgi:uncharacterized protein YdaT
VAKNDGDYRVTRTPDGDWKVKQDGAKRSVGVFDTQREAIERGRELAESARRDLVVHGENGRIRSKDSYGSETKKHDREH